MAIVKYAGGGGGDTRSALRKGVRFQRGGGGGARFDTESPVGGTRFNPGGGLAITAHDTRTQVARGLRGISQAQRGMGTPGTLATSAHYERPEQREQRLRQLRDVADYLRWYGDPNRGLDAWTLRMEALAEDYSLKSLLRGSAVPPGEAETPYVPPQYPARFRYPSYGGGGGGSTPNLFGWVQNAVTWRGLT